MKGLGASGEGCMDFPKNRELGLTIDLYSTVTSLVDFKIEEFAHSESHDAGRGPSIQHKVHSAGEAGAGEYRALCNVNPVNFDNSTWGDLG